MIPWTENDIELYSQQFDNLNRLLGTSIDEIIFYLEPTAIEFTEQLNTFGKSLFNGIEIKVGNTYLSIGCRFIDPYYGLAISEGRLPEFEYIKEEKSPTLFNSNIIGQTIKSVDIYWMKIPWSGAVGFYPQEFVIRTDKDLLLLSSFEVNGGEVNTTFTDEMLVIEDEVVAKQLKLGEYGIENNKREWFKNFDELYETDKRYWL